MTTTLTIISIVLGLLGALLVSLDILKVKHLRSLREEMLNVARDASSSRLLPYDKRANAVRYSIISVIASKSNGEDTFLQQYREQLKKNKYVEDMNMRFNYRSAIYLLGIALLVIVCIWVLAKLKAPLLSLDTLKVLGVFAFILIGITGMWVEEFLSDMSKSKCPEGYPPYYRVRGDKTVLLQLYLWILNVLANAFMKMFAQLVLLSVRLEKYTKPHQGPRIVGVLLILIAAFLQLAVLTIST